MAEIQLNPSGTVVRRGFAAKSTLEIMAEITEHGTHWGYVAGCHGSHCPGKDLVGMSCSEANMRFAGDASYRRRVSSGMSAAAIWAEDQLDCERDVVAQRVARRRKTDASTVTVPTVTVANNVEPLEEVEAQPAVEVPRVLKWKIRRAWIAFAPDGLSYSRPFQSQQDAMAYVGEQLRPGTMPASEEIAAAPGHDAGEKPKRVPRPRLVWTEQLDDLIRRRNGERVSDAKIAVELGLSQPAVSARRRELGLPSLFRSPNQRGKGSAA